MNITAAGEQRHIASLIGYFIEKIDFGRDLEQQLNTYVECRAIFCNLDEVKDKLILCVCNLAVKAFTLMKGKHSKKTSSFVKVKVNFYSFNAKQNVCYCLQCEITFVGLFGVLSYYHPFYNGHSSKA
jgi:hypothetical protein